MSGSPLEAVAQAIEAHERWDSWGIVNGEVWCNGCKQRYPEDTFGDHIAPHVLAALDLSEERQTIPHVVDRVECTCAATACTPAETNLHTCGFSPGHIEFVPSRRWVSSWTSGSEG